VGIFRREEGKKAGRGGGGLCRCPEGSRSAPNQSLEWHTVLADKKMTDHSKNQLPRAKLLGNYGSKQQA